MATRRGYIREECDTSAVIFKVTFFPFGIYIYGLRKKKAALFEIEQNVSVYSFVATRRQR